MIGRIIRRLIRKRLSNSMVVGAALLTAVCAGTSAKAQVVPERFDLRSLQAPVPPEPREPNYRLEALPEWPLEQQRGFLLTEGNVEARFGINRSRSSFLLRKESTTRLERPSLLQMRRSFGLLVDAYFR